MKTFPYWLMALAILILLSLLTAGCLETGVNYDRPDGDEATDGDDPTDGDRIPDGDDTPDGDETPECAHLCDCPQGWFCSEDGKCEDGTELEGTPFCCDNPGCPTNAPCIYANGDYGRCGETPACNCNEFYGIYCPDAENTCEEIEQVRVTGGNDCTFDIEFSLTDDSTVSMEVEGCGSFIENLENPGCSVSYSAHTNTFEIACNWCGATIFSKDNCGGEECTSWEDCPPCNECVENGGKHVCTSGDILTNCAADNDCNVGDVCKPYRPEQPQCGGQCIPQTQEEYTLHEWGVNLTHGEGSRIKAGPEHYWGAIPAKPVLYVYADQPMTLDVGVRFASGGTTETWPERPNGASIFWEDIQVTQGACDTTPTPQPEYDEWEPEDREIYQLPNWSVSDADCLTHGETVSDLLFYTGRLGAYDSPVKAELIDVDSMGSIAFRLENTSDMTVGPIQVLYRDTLGDCMDPSYCPVVEADLAWGSLEKLNAGEIRTLNLEIHHLLPANPGDWMAVEIPEAWNEQAEAMEDILADQGLFPEEIEVFMETWTDMFYGVYAEDIGYFLPEYSNGAFVLYPWPERLESEQLELSLNPRPEELSRAIIEFMQVSHGQTRTGTLTGEVTLVEYDYDPSVPIYEGPAENAIVAAWQGNALVAETTTNQNGQYRLTLPEGIYTVSVERNDWETGESFRNVAVFSGEETVQNLTLYSEAMVDKPNLYLYPTETTDVSVTLDLCWTCEVTQSIPEYGDGWNVTVEPSGRIDGEYTYLFYEAEVPRRYPLLSGWSVPAGDIPTFFEDTLLAYGLTDAETFDFVDFWSDHLPPAPHYAVFPLVEAEIIDPMVGLNIEPTPDSVFRLWFVVSPEAGPSALPEPDIRPVVRTGFTAVEWGVIID